MALGGMDGLTLGLPLGAAVDGLFVGSKTVTVGKSVGGSVQAFGYRWELQKGGRKARHLEILLDNLLGKLWEKTLVTTYNIHMSVDNP